MKANLWSTLKRGLYRKCPACGASGMFQGYLEPSDSCSKCQLDFELIRSDDAPAYFTIAVVGHIILPLASYVEFAYSPSLMFHLLLWTPLILILTLGFLPFIKGLMMAVMWRVKVRPKKA